MRTVSAPYLAVLDSSALKPRHFLYFKARNRDNGGEETIGWWSDFGNITASVIDPTTHISVPRNYIGLGSGDVVSISGGVSSFGLSAQTIEIVLSGIAPGSRQLVREWDAKRAGVELHRGLIDPNTHRLVAPAEPEWVGFVDEAPIRVGAAGGESQIKLTCTDLRQELLRSNSAQRSDADQRRRNPNDSFFMHAASVGDWRVRWWTEPGT